MPFLDSSEAAASPAKIRKTLGKTSEKSFLNPGLPPKYRFGEFQLDLAEQRLFLRGEPVVLRNRPLQVLHYLVEHRGRLIELSELLGAIWGTEDVYHDALRKAVGSIRTALCDNSQQPRFIETHWGRGYRFIGEVVEEAVDDGFATPESVATHSVAAETPATPLQAGTAVSEGAPELSAKKRRPLYLSVAAGVAAAVLLAGAATAIRYTHPTEQAKATAVSPAPSASATKPVNEAERTAYLEAQYLLSQRSSESIAQAIAIFNRIIQADPGAGDAYAGLAESYGLGYWGFWKIDPDVAVRQSAEFALKAVRADQASGYAHAQLAAAYLRQLRVRDAQAEFERALAIRPNDAEVHHAYAVFLDDTYRTDRGIQEMKRAIDLEPLSLAYKTDLGMSYFFAKRYADAIAQYKSVLKLDPGFIEAHEYLASMYVFETQWAEARAEYADIDKIRRGNAASAGESPLRLITEFKTGEIRKAQAGVRAILASPSVAHSYSLARIYAQLGRSEDALRYLSQVVNGRSPEMFSVPDDPLLTSLHGNPEFESLTDKVSAVFTIPEDHRPQLSAALVVPTIFRR